MYKYAYKDYNAEHQARSVNLNASVSTKHCIEIATRIKGKSVDAAKRILNDAIELKVAIPFKRFNMNVGHRPGMGPGRFPEKACGEVLKALNSVEANAQNKGLNSSELKIVHICANRASTPWHYGRQRRRKMKRTHIEIVVEESAPAKKDKKKPAESKKPVVEEKKVTAPANEQKKTEEKAAPAKEVKKEEPKAATETKKVEKPDTVPDNKSEEKKPVKEKVKEAPVEKTEEKPAATTDKSEGKKESK